MKNSILKIFISVCCVLALTAVPAMADSKIKKPGPDEAIRMLKKGNARFVSGKSIHPHTDAARLIQAGKENQSDYAYAAVIASSDSRVPVERIFDAGIMDIFVIRVVGNVVDVHEAGFIEYGLTHVNVPVLLVLGHTRCDAVTAVTNKVQGDHHKLEINIPSSLMENIEPAVKRAMEQHPDLADSHDIIPYAIKENVWQGVNDLFMRSPSTRELVKDGKVKVIGAIYDVGTGKIEWLPEKKVTDILAEVEKNPKRQMKALAD